MGLEYTPVAIPYLLAALLVSGVFVLLWRNRERRGAKPFLMDLTGIISLSVFDALLVLSTDLSGKLFWWNWRFVAITFMGIGYMYMAVEYTNHEQWITYKTGAAVVAVPAIVQFFIWTNASHELVYSYTFDAATADITFFFGPVYWILGAFIVAYLTAGIYLLFQLARRQTAYLRQTGIIVGGITLVLAGEILWWLHLVPYDPLPLTSLAKSTGFLFGVARFELLDIVPVARNKVIENMRDAVFVVDRTGRIVDANEAGAELVDHDDPIREPIDAVFDADAIGDYARETSAQRDVTLTVDGETRHFDFQISPLHDDTGVQSGRLFVFRDITRLKQREEELSILNRIVRHDINNDMTVIRGRSRLLEDHVDERGEKHLDPIQHSSEHVVELTENVRDLVNSITGDEDLALERIDLGTVLETQLEQARKRYEDTEFVRTDEVPDDCAVEATEMLSSVFTNLFNNAVQHNDAEVPRVTVSLSVDTDTVSVEVADNGPGIPPDQRDEIFGRGEKGLDSTGTGVGLYLVDTLVDRYGGEITVGESDAGGASFTIDLPRADVDTEAEAPLQADNQQPVGED